ncbi:MAG: tetratricopeptide repeat protein, partial [Planctomycetota bacterium]
MTTARLAILAAALAATAAVAGEPAPETKAAALRKEAIDTAERLLTEFPTDPAAHVLKASMHYNLGDSAAAEKWLANSLELDPNMAAAYDMLATIAFEKGDAERTVALCTKALDLAPDVPAVRHRMGKALLDLGQAKESIAAMQETIESFGGSSETFYLLGQGYLQSKDYEKSKDSFLVAIELVPNHTQAYFGLFTACARLGERAEADRYKQRFRELDAQDRKTLGEEDRRDSAPSGLSLERRVVAKTCMGAGQVYLKHQRLERAEDLWHRAAEIDPDDMMCRAQLVALFQQQSRQQDTQRLFEQLIEQQPTAAANYYFLGIHHLSSRRYDVAEKPLQKAVELGPKRPEGYRALAQLYLASGRRLPMARLLAARLVELEPSPKSLVLLTTACAKIGDRAGALSAIERAIRLDPENK